MKWVTNDRAIMLPDQIEEVNELMLSKVGLCRLKIIDSLKLFNFFGEHILNIKIYLIALITQEVQHVCFLLRLR